MSRNARIREGYEPRYVNDNREVRSSFARRHEFYPHQEFPDNYYNPYHVSAISSTMHQLKISFELLCIDKTQSEETIVYSTYCWS